MATTHGNTGVVKLTTNTVAEVTAWSYSISVGLTPDTAMGDSAETYVSDGIGVGSGSVTCHWDSTDTNGQEAMTVGASVTLNLYPEGADSGDDYYGGSAQIESIERSGDLGSIVSATFAYKGVLTQAQV